ncbi:MAG: PAS domain S-box protein, partial [Candidatus Thorarchaeota archaeon]
MDKQTPKNLTENDLDELIWYRLLVESLHDALGVVDSSNIVTYVNTRFCELLGYSEEEMIGKSITDFLDKENGAILAENIRKRQIGVASQYEVDWLSKSGEAICTIVAGAPIKGQDGSHKGSFAILTDISDRKKIENELKAISEKYQSLFQETPVGLLTCDISGKILRVNKVALEILGSPSEDATRQINLLTFPPLKAAGLSGFLEECIATKTTRGGDGEYTTNWGKEVLIRFKIHPAMNAEGEIDEILISFDDVGDLRKAEIALIQSEKNYRTLSEQSLQGLSVIQDSKYVYVNQAFGSIVGYSPEQIIAMPSEEGWDLVHPHDKQLLLDLAEDRNAGRPSPGSYEYRLIRKDGSVRWVEAFASIIEYEGNKAHQVAIVDISERKATEMKLAASQEMIELVINTIPQFVFWKDTDSVYLGCNENFAIIAGVGTPEKIIGKTDYDLTWKKEEADHFREVDRQIIDTGAPKYNVVESLHLDKRQTWMRTSKVPLHDEEGSVIGILGTFEDVTDTRAAEEALKSSEEKYRTLAEQSLQGIMIIQNDRVVYANKTFSNLIGRNIEELYEMEFDQAWSIFHKDDREEFKQRLDDDKAGKAVSPRFEYRIIRMDGETRWVESYSTHIEFNEEDATQIVFVDVSERRKAEKEVRTEKDRATLYLDLMGHDIRNQLQVILNSATLLRTTTDDGTRNSFLGVLEEAVQRCSRLIEEVRA